MVLVIQPLGKLRQVDLKSWASLDRVARVLSRHTLIESWAITRGRGRTSSLEPWVQPQYRRIKTPTSPALEFMVDMRQDE